MKQEREVRSQQSNAFGSEMQIKQKLKLAKQLYHKNEQEESLKIYNQIINSNHDQMKQILQAYKNRASLLLERKQYANAVADCQKYLNKTKTAVPPQIYVLYITALIKSNDIKKAKQISGSAVQQFPYHKKIQQISKLCKEKQIANDDQLYVQQMFEKLCSHPKLRQHMKDESFLTKLERLIRNPTLTNALSKIDPRIKEAADALMMADEQWH